MRIVVALVVSGCGFSSRASATIDAPVEDTFSPEVIPLDGPRTDWWDSQWHTRHEITIDTTKLTGAVTGMPVLIRLRDAEVQYSKIGAGGAALRFVDTDHVTIIPHEVDTFVSGSNSFVWIKLSMDPAASPRRLWMYYDNPNVTTSSNPAAVFGSYTSVQHLGSTGFTDSSGHNHTATSANGGSTPASTVANIGNASTFDGNNDYLELPTESDFDYTTELGVSAWFRINGFDTDFQAIVAKGDFAWRVQRAGTTRQAEFGTNTGPPDNLDATKIVDDNTWHHVAITYDGTTKRIYIDGAQEASAAAPAITNGTYSVRIGENQQAGESSYPGGYRRWNGNIDEVRIGATMRDAAWIRAEYVTVNDTSFAAVGPAEPY